MSHDYSFDYFEKMAHWSFDEYEIREECLTDWDLYELLRRSTDSSSAILDLGTAGGEKIFSFFPDCAEILGTDYSPAMIDTALQNLEKSGRKNISFKVMDNLKMDVPPDHFDAVVARHTIIDPVQILECLKPGGRLLVRGVDKYDCWGLKIVMGGGQGFDDPVPVSITDYENILSAGFSEVELVPIHTREYFKDKETFRSFLKTVPILEGVSIGGGTLDESLLDKYVTENSAGGHIILYRAYYGISARKPD